MMDDLSFKEFVSMSEEEANVLMKEYNESKAQREEANRLAFVVLPKHPIILLDCIQFLRRNGALDMIGIFRINGDVGKLKMIKKSYTEDLNNFDVLLSIKQAKGLKVFDAATLLKNYLGSLNESIMPTTVYDCVKDAMDETDAVAKVTAELSKIPEPSLSVFAYSMLFFQEVINKADVNKMNAANMATCLTMSLFRINVGDDPMNVILKIEESKAVLRALLSNIDYTNLITPEKYYELLMATTHDKQALPETFELFKETEHFTRFKPT